MTTTITQAAIDRYQLQEREGFSLRISELTHYDELVGEGLSSQHASIAVRIADRRATAEFYPRAAEVVHHLCERLGNTPAGRALRLALNDDGRSQAKASNAAGLSRQTASKSVSRISQRLTEKRLTWSTHT